MALFEIMEIDDEMRELIMKEASTAACSAPRPASAACGRCASRGLLAIYEGQTTIDEVVRETITEE
jgi:type IV pilus assembly protein PilB